MKKRVLILSAVLSFVLLCGNILTACFESSVPKTLSGISVTAPPAKTVYVAGESFDAAGMAVTAFYNDLTENPVTDYTVAPSGALAVTDKFVTVTFEGKTVKQTVTVNPVVERALFHLSVTEPPAKIVYTVGESFNKAGMTVKALYSDLTEQTVTDYTVSPSGALAVSDTFVTVSFGGKTAKQTIAVNVGKADYFSKDFDTSLCSFYDKFEGNTLDMSKWIYQNGDGSAYGNPGWGNNESQYYQPDNITVQNGKLMITAKKESKSGKPYTSGKLVTHDSLSGASKFAQTYGRFEAKVRLTKADQGIWPAFWMMPKDSHYGGWPRSGEIDIMEMKGRYPMNASSAIHFRESWGNAYRANEYTFPNGLDLTNFHIFGVEWNADSITFLVDGEPHVTYMKNEWTTFPSKNEQDKNDSSPFDKDFYMLLNLAVGGNFDGGRLPSDSNMPIAMEVDFVRAYSLQNNPWSV